METVTFPVIIEFGSKLFDIEPEQDLRTKLNNGSLIRVIGSLF